MSEKIKDAYERFCRRQAQAKRIRELRAAKAEAIATAEPIEPPRKAAKIVIKRSDGTTITIAFRGEALPLPVADHN